MACPEIVEDALFVRFGLPENCAGRFFQCKNRDRMKLRQKFLGTKMEPWTIWPCKNHAKMSTPSKNGMKLCYVLMYLCMLQSGIHT